MIARLDWHAFTARFYPGRARHDFRVLKAYEVYRNGFADGSLGRPAETEGFDAWEDEGGASR